MKRIDKHTMHMINAKLYSKRSTCYRQQDGSIIVIGNLTFGGYVGNQPKQTHCIDIYYKTGGTSHCNCNSSEYNALSQILLSKYPVSTYDGATIYMTGELTLEKINQLVTAGINEIVYLKINRFEEDEIRLFATFNDIKLVCYSDEETIINEHVSTMMDEVNSIFSSTYYEHDGISKVDSLINQDEEQKMQIDLLLNQADYDMEDKSEEEKNNDE